MITPGGFEIYFYDQYDFDSGGQLDQDDVPIENGLYVENIFFPLDGSAPRGTYTYFVVNYFQVGSLPDAFTLEVFLGDTLQVSQSGVVSASENGTEYTFILN